MCVTFSYSMTRDINIFAYICHINKNDNRNEQLKLKTL